MIHLRCHIETKYTKKEGKSLSSKKVGFAILVTGTHEKCMIEVEVKTNVQYVKRSAKYRSSG